MPESPRPLQTPAYGDAPYHKYGLLAPKFWHGLRLGDWWRLFSRNRFDVSLLHWSTSGTITGAAVFNSVFSALNGALLGRRIDGLELAAPPLFVLGHWRSGTTMLHEMLIRDPEHTFPNTYQCYAPHHFLLTEAWITPVSGWLLPKHRPMDNVETGWKKPQEDEFALCNLGVPTPYLSWMFPAHGPVNNRWLTLDKLSDADRRRWVAALKRFVHSVAYRKNQRVVLKSPPHTARVRLLLEAFPDARFVHIVRDPLTLFPSTVRLWKSLCDTQGLGPPRAEYDWIEPLVLDNLAAMYEAFERDRPLIPPGRLAEVRYERLVADPIGELRRVYREADLGDFGRIEPHLGDFLKKSSEYQTNRYALAPEVEARVRERWAAYFERYGYA